MRIDIWDVQKPTQASDLDCGYARNFKEIFDVGRKLGKGGFGTVNVVTEKATGKEYACKSIKKRLEVLNVSAERQAQHLDNIDREATVLRRLRGTLSVAYLKGVWEDEENVHLVMEYCRGGELHHSIGQRVYTEETVARYLHQVLQCIAQCHHQRILHRDIKPGNFLLLDDTDMSPIKAIDFGLAVFYDPEKLPRTDLGLEGTPWFMAPEVLSSQTYPASDVWSAGVLCYQLLCGYLPFDDRKNPDAPALSTVWHAILTEEPSMRRSSWKNISEEAKKFVVNLLIKDPAKRPTAKEALQHCWLQSSFHKDRSRPLSSTVVQRIQRFAQTNLLKRTVFELIASELLKIVPPHLSDPSKSGGTEALESLEHQPSTFADSDMSEASDDNKASCEDSEHVGGVFSMSPEKPTGSPPQVVARQRRNSIDVPSHHHLTSIRKRYHPKSASMKFSPSLEQISALARAASRTGAATVHGPGEYWRILRQASELAALGELKIRITASFLLYTSNEYNIPSCKQSLDTAGWIIFVLQHGRRTKSKNKRRQPD